MRIRVLGVDPAAAGLTGYGVVETDGRACRLVCFGALPGRRGGSPQHLREIHNLMAQLVQEFSPDAVAVESVFTALNMKTALKLAEVRGVVLLAAAQGNIPVHSYSPREVKATVAGYGDASKRQMQQIVRALLGLREAPEPADAADALAVALCHIHCSAARARLASVAPLARKRLPQSPARPDGSGARSHSAAPRIPTGR